MRKSLLRLPGGILGFLRPLTRVGDTEPGRNHQNLRQHLLLACLDQHPAEGGIERQARQLMTQRGHFMFIAQRPQFVQQFITGADRGRQGWIEKGKGLDLPEAERLHAQDDFREIRPLDFRLGKTRTFFIVVLTEQAHTDPVAQPPGPAGALVGAALGDCFDGKPFGPGARRIPAHARQAGIDHITDPGNRQGSLGDIGGHQHPAFPARRENPLLFFSGHPAIQSQNLHPAAEAAFQQIAGLADIALGGHEDEDIAFVRFQKHILGGPGGRFDEFPFPALFDRPITDLHRIGPAADFNHRSASKGLRKGRGVDGGRRD